MWHTERGDRVLENAEAKLFATSVLDMIQSGMLDDDFYADYIPIFDALTYPQKVALLHYATQALFRPEVPMPELTAVLESAVAAVIQNIYWLVEEEVLETPNHTSFRSLVGQACRELIGEEEIELPDDSSDDLDDWLFCVDCLHDAILWDSDYLGEENFVDLPPEHAQAMRDVLGVSPEYYSAIAHDPAPPQLKILHDELETLCLRVSETDLPETVVLRKKSGGKRRKSVGTRKKSGARKSKSDGKGKKADSKEKSKKKPSQKKPGKKKPPTE